MSDENIIIEQLSDSQISPNDTFVNFKVIIIGDSGVGKSSLLKRAVQNRFDENYQATIGFEFLLMHFNVNNLKIKLQIWDTCGQELYKSLVQGFYRNTSLAIILYDVHRKETFKNAEKWVKDIKDNSDKKIPIFIVGNKIDLDKKVTTEEGKIFSTSNRAIYFTEASAKTGQQCNEIFIEAAKYLYSTYNISGGEKNENERLKIDNVVKKPKRGCCSGPQDNN